MGRLLGSRCRRHRHPAPSGQHASQQPEGRRRTGSARSRAARLTARPVSAAAWGLAMLRAQVAARVGGTGTRRLSGGALRLRHAACLCWCCRCCCACALRQTFSSASWMRQLLLHAHGDSPAPGAALPRCSAPRSRTPGAAGVSALCWTRCAYGCFMVRASIPWLPVAAASPALPATCAHVCCRDLPALQALTPCPPSSPAGCCNTPFRTLPAAALLLTCRLLAAGASLACSTPAEVAHKPSTPLHVNRLQLGRGAVH